MEPLRPLTCTSCSKSFPSLPALERHRLRCRFRTRNRKKACAECARSKVRCDQGVPICSRCAVHALPCAYPRTEPLGANHTQPAATPSGSRGVSFPPTTSSDLSQPHWTSSTTSQGADFPNQQHLFSVAGWVSDGSIEWPSEAPSLPNESYHLGGCPLESLYVPTGEGNPPLIADASQIPPVYLGDAWMSAEHGLDYIDGAIKGYVDGFATGLYRPSFIHFRDWDEARRPLALVEAASVAQIYRTTTRASDSVLIRSIDAQLLHIQRNIASHTRAEDVSTLQTTLLYAGMRVYRAGPTASEPLDRVSSRLMQHVLSKSLHCITPHTNPNPEDWESWIQDESIRRCFFMLHALDYAAHARQSLPTAVCALFPEAPLPCPSRVWEAPTAEEWAVRYRAWEEYYCGGASSSRGPLRGRDVLCWVRGRETGRREQLRVWLQGVEPELGGLVFECGRAQGRTAGVGELL